jgi:hypothetical protein
MPLRPTTDERSDSNDCRPLAPFRICSLDKSVSFDEDEEMFDGFDFSTLEQAFEAGQRLANQFGVRMQVINKFSNSVEAINPESV